jgi:hypothetical protein
MPVPQFVLTLLSVLVAAAVTVWLLSLAGPGLMAAALPAFLIAALAMRYLGR